MLFMRLKSKNIFLKRPVQMYAVQVLAMCEKPPFRSGEDQLFDFCRKE